MPLADTITLNNGNKMPLLGLGTFAADDGGKVSKLLKYSLNSQWGTSW